MSDLTASVISAEDIRDADLRYIAGSLAAELPRLEGSNLLLTGGAGFLGYYLVQSILWWNQNGAAQSVQVTMLDNFRRGLPPGSRPSASAQTWPWWLTM